MIVYMKTSISGLSKYMCTYMLLSYLYCGVNVNFKNVNGIATTITSKRTFTPNKVYKASKRIR